MAGAPPARLIRASAWGMPLCSPIHRHLYRRFRRETTAYGPHATLEHVDRVRSDRQTRPSSTWSPISLRGERSTSAAAKAATASGSPPTARGSPPSTSPPPPSPAPRLRNCPGIPNEQIVWIIGDLASWQPTGTYELVSHIVRSYEFREVSCQVARIWRRAERRSAGFGPGLAQVPSWHAGLNSTRGCSHSPSREIAYETPPFIERPRPRRAFGLRPSCRDPGGTKWLTDRPSPRATSDASQRAAVVGRVPHDWAQA